MNLSSFAARFLLVVYLLGFLSEALYSHLWLIKSVYDSRFRLSCLRIHESHDTLFLWGAKMCLISSDVSSSETSTCQKILGSMCCPAAEPFFSSLELTQFKPQSVWDPCQLVLGDTLGTGLMCVKERMARWRLARDRWGWEVAISREIWRSWGGGGVGVSTQRQEPEQDTEATWEIRGLMSCKQSRGVMRWKDYQRDERRSSKLKSFFFSSFFFNLPTFVGR